MKNKFLIILFSFISLVNISCDNNDDTKGINSNANPFIGKWTVKQTGEIQNINNTNIVVYTDYENTSSCENDYYMFNEDYTYSANEVDPSDCHINIVENGTYEIGSDTIILTFQEEIGGEIITYTSSATIISLTYDTLELSFRNISDGVSFLKFSR